MPPSPAALSKGASLRKVAVFVIGALTTLYIAGSGSYIVFHDTISAALLSRQATQQYAYEDRIAELRAALDAERSQTMRADMTQDGAIRDLATQAARLAARADSLDRLMTGKLGEARLRAEADSPGELQTTAGIANRLAGLEARQRETIDALTVRTTRDSARMQTALAQLGLAQPPTATDVGGPLEPLDGDETSIDAVRPLEEAVSLRSRLAAATDKLPLREPVVGNLDVTSGFGARRDPFLGRLALHTGVDLRESYGSPVLATGAGIVTVAGTENGYGTMVEVDHGNGYATRYAHLSNAAVRVGDRVAAGMTIGAVGTTGRSTGPHLHYEVRIAGEPVDPMRYLSLAAAIAAR